MWIAFFKIIISLVHKLYFKYNYKLWLLSRRFVMDFFSELVYQNGLPIEFVVSVDVFPGEESPQQEPVSSSSQNLLSPRSQPSSDNLFKPNSDEHPRHGLKLRNKPSVDIEYKRKAVAWWKSGVKKRKSVSSVRRRFKKVKSERMLFKWFQQVNAECRSEKLRLVQGKTWDSYLQVCLNLPSNSRLIGSFD